MQASSRDVCTLQVDILGKQYQVSCPSEQREALQRAARQLDQRMRDVRARGQVIGLERIAVMVALNLSHELLEAQGRVEGWREGGRRLNRQAEDLLEALAAALEC